MRTRPDSTLLAIIDVQERLLPAIPSGAQIVDRLTRLAEGAAILGIRRALMEQYPKGLGHTPPAIASLCPAPIEKLAFSCCGSDAFNRIIDAAVENGPGEPRAESIVIAGLETHVCVLQTALDLLARGLTVFITVDAVGSRSPLDHQTALQRLAASGAILTTSESVLFEWCRTADHPQFQAIRQLVLRPPAAPSEPPRPGQPASPARAQPVRSQPAQ